VASARIEPFTLAVDNRWPAAGPDIVHTTTQSIKATRIIANIRPTRRDEPAACVNAPLVLHDRQGRVRVTAGWDAMVEQTRNASR